MLKHYRILKPIPLPLPTWTNLCGYADTCDGL